MHGHFDESHGSVPAATTDITRAEPTVAHRPDGGEADRPTGPSALPISHARPFSPQDLIDDQEWASSGEFG
ncbi:hypothetical protein ACVXZ4_10160 [Lacisediminihabitans sp. FW035]